MASWEDMRLVVERMQRQGKFLHLDCWGDRWVASFEDEHSFVLAQSIRPSAPEAVLDAAERITEAR